LHGGECLEYIKQKVLSQVTLRSSIEKGLTLSTSIITYQHQYSLYNNTATKLTFDLISINTEWAEKMNGLEGTFPENNFKPLKLAASH